MSQWTHVNASIRFDALRAVGLAMLPDLGKTCTFESSNEEFEACNVPCGSEGSLQHHLWVNPHTSSLAAYTAMFWGDLRDYDDDKAILEYFEKITKEQMIRSGVLEIDIEGRTPQVYRFDVETRKWESFTLAQPA